MTRPIISLLALAFLAPALTSCAKLDATAPDPPVPVAIKLIMPLSESGGFSIQSGSNVGIDIKPGSCPNSINLYANGRVAVAILGSATFDVTDVDVSTVVFAGASPVHFGTEDIPVADGFLDLVLHFERDDLDLESGDTTACLTGELLDGTPISGCDSVRIVPD